MQAYRPQSLKIYIKLNVEFEFEVEHIKLMRPGPKIQQKHPWLNSLFNPFVGLYGGSNPFNRRYLQSWSGTRMKRTNHPSNLFSSWSLGWLGWKLFSLYFPLLLLVFAGFCYIFLGFFILGGCQHRTYQLKASCAWMRIKICEEINMTSFLSNPGPTCCQ